MRTSLDQRLLRLLRDRAPRAVHAGELVTRAGLPRDKLDEVIQTLERMRDDGRAVEMPGKRYRFARDTPRPAAHTSNTSNSGHAGHGNTAASSRRHDGALDMSERPRDSRPAFQPRNDVRTRGNDSRIAPSSAQSSRPAPRIGRDDRDFRAREAPPPENVTSIVRGVLMLHARGFGFITPDDGRAEVHIPPHEIGPALHGDRVEVEARFGFRGREGRVVGIIERRRPRLIGTLHGDFARSLVFAPGDPRLPERMRILPPVPRDIAVGDAVVAEIREYPQNQEDTAGVVVTERLGVPGDVGVEVERILARDGVVEAFSEDVLAEARRIPEVVTEADMVGRRDLRKVPLSTVDPDDARDHDDALWAEALSDGGFKVIIAIADVSHYVRPATAIDNEALARCTSIYLPSRAIPMLPREISSKMASLLPGEDRLCMGVEVNLGPQGQIRSHEFFEGVMRSRARITYGGAARALGLTTEPRRQREAEGQLPSLRALLDAAKVMRAKRERRGSIDFDLPEAKIVLGEDGAPIDVAESRRDPGVREAYRMVEEMMLLANELVAEHLTTLGLPAIHRIHPPPEEKRIELFCQLAQSLGYDLDPDDARRPKTLARFVEKTADTKEAPFLRFLLLRAMSQASYSLDDEMGHFGLAAPHYLHFTSPIRRYPDLAVHRVLRAWLRKEPIDRAALVPKLRMQSVESSRLERRAMNVERDVVKVHEVAVMRDRVGDVYEGAISSVDTDSITVRLDSPFVDVTLELARFTSSRYELDKLGLRLTSRSGHSFGAGDRLRVSILDANMNMRRTFGVPVAESAEQSAPSQSVRDVSRKKSRARDDIRPAPRALSANAATTGRAKPREHDAHAAPRRAEDHAKNGAPASKPARVEAKVTKTHAPTKPTTDANHKRTRPATPAPAAAARATSALTPKSAAKTTPAPTKPAAKPALALPPAKPAAKTAPAPAKPAHAATKPNTESPKTAPTPLPTPTKAAAKPANRAKATSREAEREVAPARAPSPTRDATRRKAPAQRSSADAETSSAGVDPKKARRRPTRTP